MAQCTKKDCFWYERHFFNDKTAFLFREQYGHSGYPKSCEFCTFSLKARIAKLENQIVESRATAEKNYLKDNRSLDWLLNIEGVEYKELKYSNSCIVCKAQNCVGIEYHKWWVKKKCNAVVGSICYECMKKNKKNIKSFLNKVTKEQFKKFESF